MTTTYGRLIKLKNKHVEELYGDLKNLLEYYSEKNIPIMHEGISIDSSNLMYGINVYIEKMKDVSQNEIDDLLKNIDNYDKEEEVKKKPQR